MLHYSIEYGLWSIYFSNDQPLDLWILMLFSGVWAMLLWKSHYAL